MYHDAKFHDKRGWKAAELSPDKRKIRTRTYGAVTP